MQLLSRTSSTTEVAPGRLYVHTTSPNDFSLYKSQYSLQQQLENLRSVQKLVTPNKNVGNNKT